MQKRTKLSKQILSFISSLIMIFSLLPMSAMADTISGDPVAYLDYDYDSGEFVTKSVSASDYTEVIDTTITLGEEGKTTWYVVSGSMDTRSRITVSGDVHLILVDGCKWYTNGGITVEGENSLTIYAQSNDESTMGKMFSNTDYSVNAGIGGENGNNCGTVIINGGYINAGGVGTDTDCGAGIGGGAGADGGNITINGGIVTGNGSCGYNGEKGGAGIGGGNGGNAGYITINGGVVSGYTVNGSASIGGGCCGDGGDIIIAGGTVTADVIGCGANGEGGSVTISGGSVIANGCGGQGASIGGVGSTVTITGGTVMANKSYFKYVGQIINGYVADTGIGGTNSTVVIKGGVVKAIGGGKSNGTGGPAIGGGDVIISGGDITAYTGYCCGAAIGGSGKNEGGSVTITGGTIYAATGAINSERTDTTAIGNGMDGSGCKVTISGGTFTTDTSFSDTLANVLVDG